MATWDEVCSEAPELAKVVRARFDVHKHKTMATLRQDGSPRISGMEAEFALGELWLGMMPGSRKARDLQRDPRVALHSATIDLDVVDGDAKIAGRAVEIEDQATFDAYRQAVGAEEQGPGEAPMNFHLFRVDVNEVVLTRIGDPPDHLVIETWRPDRGVKRVTRY